MSLPKLATWGCRLCHRLERSGEKHPPRGCGVYPGCMKRYEPASALDGLAANVDDLDARLTREREGRLAAEAARDELAKRIDRMEAAHAEAVGELLGLVGDSIEQRAARRTVTFGVNEPEMCARLLVGQGTDTWDPECCLPRGHDGSCMWRERP